MSILSLLQSISTVCIIVLPLSAIACGFYANRLDRKDLPKNKSTLMPEYIPPENLTILEVAVLLDNKLDFADLSAEFLNLMLLGIAKFDGQNLTLINDQQKIDRLPEAEKDIMNILFEDLQNSKLDLQKINELSKNKFYAIKNYIYGLLVEKGYYPISPLEQRKTFYRYINLLFTIGIILLILNFFWRGILFLLPFAFLISGFILAFFGEKKSKKTLKGFEIYQRALGYKYFIQKAEKDRINYLLKNEADQYYQALPYAYIFHVTRQWQADKKTGTPLYFDQFKNIDVYDPGFADSFTKRNIFTWFIGILRSAFFLT